MRSQFTGVLRAIVLVASFAANVSPGAEPAKSADYADVAALFNQHCLDCHGQQEPDGQLILETHEALMKGGESGASVVPGKSSDSLLVKLLEGKLEKDGKPRVMPPGKRKKLEPAEVAVIRAWIDGGAKPPQKAVATARDLVLPQVRPSVPPRRSIQALAFASGPGLIAVGRYQEVELLAPGTRTILRTLGGHRGTVNAVAFSKDGQYLAAAAGEPALFGEVRLWKVADGTLVRSLEGHADALYSVAISPDGKVLATGSYDQKIKLWELESGRELQTLSAHNGAIFDLAFRPDGKILASASGDRTVKLWNVATGKRVETLSQPLKEQYALAWSPDGKRLAAAGVDNRIRVWEVSESAAETTNPLLLSKFAHEGAILNLMFSPDGSTILTSADDRSLKLWDAITVTEKRVFELQPDVSPALTFLADARMFAVGRLDGTIEVYEAQNGKKVPPAAPEVSSIHPRGLQRGTTGTFRIRGKNLDGVTNVVSDRAKLAVRLQAADRRATELVLELVAAEDLDLGPRELSVVGGIGPAGKVKVWVDDLRQVAEVATNEVAVIEAPASFWGVLDKPGDTDEVEFAGKAGEVFVFELSTKSIGSKLANGAVTVMDEHGKVLGVDRGFDGQDRFVSVQLPNDGRYRARVADQMLGASAEHLYRLSVGALPYVTGVFPMSVPVNTESRVELLGVNLPAGYTRTTVKPAEAGEVEVPLERRKVRFGQVPEILAAEGPQLVEQEPNEQKESANAWVVPGAVNGRIAHGRDVDLFRFKAGPGELWILETDAARRGSPVDTRLEILDAAGGPVPRLLLQAVRNTTINFRSIDSNNAGMRLDNYEEMELNEYLFLNGDVMRLFRMPQGPDSDMLMYMSAGKRRAYFDTTAVAHALDEPGYIVEPHPLGAKLANNGLPVFTLHYENDDDAERKLGRDSRIFFSPPKAGEYLARVTDTRGHGGEMFSYRLVARKAQPDFKVTLNGVNPTVPPGSGQSFGAVAERFDGFEGEIRVELTDLPPGFQISSPLVIEAGHTEARGTIFAAADAKETAGGETKGGRGKALATAMIDGRKVTRPAGELGTIKVGAKPKLYVGVEAYSESATNAYDPARGMEPPLELVIAPGQTIPAWLKIKRNGHDALVTFFAENLPHGVIVADIGLNGVLIAKEENERQIFFNAAKWVEEQDRYFHLIEQQAGRQTSRPVLLRVRKPSRQAAVGP